MQLAVALIHGMGWQSPAFAEPTIAELSDRLEDLEKDPEEVAWQSIYWADILTPRQVEYLDAARAANDLDYVALRKFVVSALGDAAAYQYVESPSSTYSLIHDRIRHAMHELYAGTLASQPVPLVVLAHSLGAHITSSYIWDTQQQSETGPAQGSSEFERMEWLAGLVTFGANIPLFTFAYDPVVAIRFPGSALPPEDADRAKWLNYYDKDDVLGYPLKQTSPSYDATVTEDLEINVGAFGVSGTPLSHGAYWTDNDFTRPVASFLSEFL